jgi:hypothetical protein
VAPKYISFSAWIYLTIALLTLVDAFVQAPILIPLTSVLIIIFVFIEFRLIPIAQKIAGSGLIILGILFAAENNNWLDIIIDGIARSRIFLLLFFAVSWLHYPASQSPALQATRTTIISKPPGQRYLYMAFGVHFIGSVLNLAGLSLFANLVKDHKNQILRTRFTMALINGFGSASSWSPFFIGMIVVLIAIPSLTWRDIGPLGMIIALAIISTSWAYDRLILRSTNLFAEANNQVPLSSQNFWRMAGIILSLISLVLLIVEFIGSSIPITLGLIAPPFSLIWHSIISQRVTRFPYRNQSLTINVLASLPTLRNESIVFVAANIFGVGISSIVPTGDLSSVINSSIPWADLRICAIIMFFLFTSAVGLHPVIVVISLTSILPPEALGLADWVVGVTYASIWGLSTMVSPFSGTTLLMSRITGVPAHIIGWRWMLPTSVINCCVISIIIISLRHLLS